MLQSWNYLASFMCILVYHYKIEYSIDQELKNSPHFKGQEASTIIYSPYEVPALILFYIEHYSSLYYVQWLCYLIIVFNEHKVYNVYRNTLLVVLLYCKHIPGSLEPGPIRCAIIQCYRY